MHSKVSSDWMPSYIKATCPVLEIWKMVGTFRTGFLPLYFRMPDKMLQYLS
jgi:hypothetical protein